jgi:hypothetical protein
VKQKHHTLFESPFAKSSYNFQRFGFALKHTHVFALLKQIKIGNGRV